MWCRAVVVKQEAGKCPQSTREERKGKQKMRKGEMQTEEKEETVSEEQLSDLGKGKAQCGCSWHSCALLFIIRES